MENPAKVRKTIKTQDLKRNAPGVVVNTAQVEPVLRWGKNAIDVEKLINLPSLINAQIATKAGNKLLSRQSTVIVLTLSQQRTGQNTGEIESIYRNCITKNVEYS